MSDIPSTPADALSELARRLQVMGVQAAAAKHDFRSDRRALDFLDATVGELRRLEMFARAHAQPAPEPSVAPPMLRPAVPRRAVGEETRGWLAGRVRQMPRNLGSWGRS